MSDSSILKGIDEIWQVVFALSGYVNPERKELRELGLAMGADYRPDWAKDATHLACKFGGTAKIKEAEKSGGKVVKGEWIRECKKARKRLPEADFVLSGSSAPSTITGHFAPTSSPKKRSSSSTAAPSGGSGASDGGSRGGGSGEAAKKARSESSSASAAARSARPPPKHPPASHSDSRASLGGGEGDEKGERAAVGEWVKEDVKKAEAFLRARLGGDGGAGGAASVDVADVARKGVVEAVAVAEEALERDGTFDHFTHNWEGPVPEGLKRLVRKHGSGADIAAARRALRRLHAHYADAVRALSPAPAAPTAGGKSGEEEEGPREWVEEDVRKFEAYLREAFSGRADVDLADIARQGVVEAIADAEESVESEGSFGAFEREWEGPVPEGLKRLMAKHKADAGSKEARAALRRLKERYGEAVSALPPLPPPPAAAPDSRGGGKQEKREKEEGVAQWVEEDVRKAEAFLRSEWRGRTDVDFAEVARQGVVAAITDAEESVESEGSFGAFEREWEGPVPEGLKRLMAKHKADAGSKEARAALRRLKERYGEAVSALPPLPPPPAAPATAADEGEEGGEARAQRSDGREGGKASGEGGERDGGVEEWVGGDVERMEKFLLRAVLRGAAPDFPLRHVARQGVVEAIADAEESVRRSESFEEFEREWEGPVPEGLKRLMAKHKADAGSKEARAALRRLKERYREALR